MALHLAIGLFVTEEATLGQAAQVAGRSQADFLRELGQRRIPIHYGPEELADDLRAVEFWQRNDCRIRNLPPHGLADSGGE